MRWGGTAPSFGAVFLAWGVVVTAVGSPVSGTPSEPLTPFPFHPSLRPAVQFWIDVYSKISTAEGYLHDAEDLTLRYEIVSLSHPRGSRSAQREIDERRNHVQSLLRSILAKNRMGLTSEEEELLIKFGPLATDQRLERAIGNVRFQLGQADRFRKGVEIGSAYKPRFREILREEGLPEEIVFLPHVESSFQNTATSKYGAAGMWQFMRQTARRYMKVNASVDERFDPFVAARAAARHLKREYELLGRWPLAILAYNHGAASVKRAINRLGTREIHEIIASYEARSFGFASKNFYPSFLAAMEVAQNYSKYFGEIDLQPPVESVAVPLAHPMSILELASLLQVPRQVIQELNPALRPAVVNGGRPIPKGYALNVHADQVAMLSKLKLNTELASRQEWVAAAPVRSRPVEPVSPPKELFRTIPNLHQEIQVPEFSVPKERSLQFVRVDGAFGWIRVDGDETLGHFADWAQTTPSHLRRINGVRSRNTLEVGQLLKIDLSRTSTEEFERKRTEYHRQIEEEFFAQYAVTGVIPHRLKAGETLWILSRDLYRVPTWLIQRHNTNVDWQKLWPGVVLQVPQVEPRTVRSASN